LEKARPDCTFVYLTHDLPFAADRIGATKICINEFLDGAFSWYSKTLISMKFLKTSS
jgi:hypothetical protein